jgi:hypothetical protein
MELPGMGQQQFGRLLQHVYTPIEYARVDGAVDTGSLPGKYYVGCNVERLCGSALLRVFLLSFHHVLRINIPTKHTGAYNVHLITATR